ncbi:MAG: hypothetical protein R6V10_05775 [bacterium]
MQKNKRLSEWMPWSRKDNFNGKNNPGVYVLAKFSGKLPSGPADPSISNVIYIGETCNQSLARRWYQFGRSAFESRGGHSGGWTYLELFGDSGHDLYVAALAITKEEPYLSADIRLIEREFLSKYVYANNEYPNCNRK